MKFSAPKLVRAYLFLYYQPTDVRQLAFDIEAVLNKELLGRYTPAFYTFLMCLKACMASVI